MLKYAEFGKSLEHVNNSYDKHHIKGGVLACPSLDLKHNRPSSRRTTPNSHHDLWKLSFCWFCWEKIEITIVNIFYTWGKDIVSFINPSTWAGNLNKILFLPRFLSLVACDNDRVFKRPIILFSKSYSPDFDLYYSVVFLSCIQFLFIRYRIYLYSPTNKRTGFKSVSFYPRAFDISRYLRIFNTVNYIQISKCFSHFDNELSKQV